MPRIYTSANDPLDFCRQCFPATEEIARELYGNVGDGPDDRGNCFGYNESHPCYSDVVYKCETCKKELTKRDNDPYVKPPRITLIFDTALDRPACVLLQAIYHCQYGPAINLFKPSTWLVSQTPDMKRVILTLEEWKQVAERVNAKES